jgi:cytochrome c553
MMRVLCAAALLTVIGMAAAQNQKDLSIKDIMGKAHKGGDSLIGKLGKQLKADAPNWEEVQGETKELVSLGTGLGKNTPPKGEKESWDKLTKNYVTTAKELDADAQRKDKNAGTGALTQLRGMCANCHKAHKG